MNKAAKRAAKHPIAYLVLGILFFIILGAMLMSRDPAAKPEVLINVRDAHDSLIHTYDSLKDKLEKTTAQNAMYRRRLSSLERLDTINARLSQQINILSDSIKRANEKPPIVNTPAAAADVSDFFSKEYQ